MRDLLKVAKLEPRCLRQRGSYSFLPFMTNLLQTGMPWSIPRRLQGSSQLKKNKAGLLRLSFAASERRIDHWF
jgi:hypothetical protein